jgi:hypothetical protein
MDPGFAQGNPWIAQIHASRITYKGIKGDGGVKKAREKGF